MLYKRRGVYYLDLTVGDRRIRKTTGTREKELAKAYHDKVEKDLWRVEKLGERPRRTWNEAVVRWLKERSHLAGVHLVRLDLRWVDPYLDGKRLDEIDQRTIDKIKEDRLATGVANATVNKTLQAVRGVLRAAHREWEWLEHVPPIRFLPEPKKRVRFLSREDAEKLLAALPDHLSDMARFALATGLRMSNVTGLEWSQVDLERRFAWIHPDQAKARKAIPVPLNADAVLCLRKQVDKHKTAVFTFEGNPVKRTNGRAWRKALIRAGIDNFRWHDLRHTWASWHIQNGTPLQVLQELGGWSDSEMVQRYAHLASEHLAEYADKLSRPRVVTSTAHKEDAEDEAKQKMA